MTTTSQETHQTQLRYGYRIDDEVTDRILAVRSHRPEERTLTHKLRAVLTELADR